MLSHAFIGVTELDRAFAFYSAVIAPLGHRLRFHDPAKPWAGGNPRSR
ncbi:MAG: hypothetical protein AB7O49_11710 [Sphingomonadales bacterium]